MNAALARAEIDMPGLFPRLEALADAPAVFRMEFGLDALPLEPGVIFVRGARQSGKSTWLEGALRETIERFGPGSAFYLNGDAIRDVDDLDANLARLGASFSARAPVRRLFVDEITAIDDWWKALKRVLDRGELRRVLVVTTGSRATDLRRGVERLPGRKGRLARTTYLFLPVSYSEFTRAGGSALGDQTLPAYLISGGSPLACAELMRTGKIPEWVIEVARDWIAGECARAGRPRHSLLAVMQELHRHGGSPIGQTKLAKEAGLANNTVAAGWIEFLADLLCVGISPAWLADRERELPRKPAKFPFVNLLVATAFAPSAPRTSGDLLALPPEIQACWHEWVVAQELFRRAALRGDAEPERIPYWRSADQEIDFVADPSTFVEVKHGMATALDFSWFTRSLPPTGRLTVVCTTPFEANRVRGVTLEDLLQNGP